MLSRFTVIYLQRMAFTLAEVLLTLGIIGVVAAMTIPTLIQHTQKTEYVAIAKKTYSALEQALQKAEIDYGGRKFWTFGTVGGNGDEAVAFSNTYLVPYLNLTKNCGKSTGCWATTLKRFDGSTHGAYGDITIYSKFILSDGVAINVYTAPTSAFLHFDVNGPTKGPNIYGQDVLTYSIEQSYAPAYGSNWSRATILSETINGCNKAASQPDTCLILIIKDGWQIKDDYPWN